MNIELIYMARLLLGLFAGSAVGFAFGLVQRAAVRRFERLMGRGEFSSGWVVVPGSAGRVAFLLLALVLVQVLCPMLFVGGTEWLVSAGVLIGYGALLYKQCVQRPSSRLAKE